jgi:hypothetical protein
MIFNCECCGKSVSSKKEMCPYCRADITEFSLYIEQRALARIKKDTTLSNKILERLKGTFASVRF